MLYQSSWPVPVFAFLLFVAANFRSLAQSAPPRLLEDSSFINTTEVTEFAGGTKTLVRYLNQQVRYPKAAADAGISGRVFTSFVVDTTGCISAITILKGLGYGCDEEAIRVISEMPRWKPGKESGQAVQVKYNLPVQFPPAALKKP